MTRADVIPYRYTMSSVHKLPGKPNWICYYCDHTGRRRVKSTLTTDKREATRICGEIQKVEDKAKTGRLTEDRARKVIESTVSEIMESLGSPMVHNTIGEHFRGWIKSREMETSKGTIIRYQGIVSQFLDFLGPKTGKALALLSSRDVEAYRDTLAGKVSNQTVNTHLKVLRVCLEKAVKQRVFDTNPARLIDNLDASTRHQRRPFTIPELQKLLANASDDWRTAIYFGLYTGQRLGDVCNLTWANLDLQNAELTIATEKTGKVVILPIVGPLKKRIECLPAGDDPTAPICPSLAGKVESALSNQFFELMASAGLVKSRSDHGAKKQGRGSRRVQSAISFHSLRHTATSLLKRAGVSNAVTMDLIGHDSAAISKNYTNIDMPTKRAAMEKMPDIAA